MRPALCGVVRDTAKREPKYNNNNNNNNNNNINSINSN